MLKVNFMYQYARIHDFCVWLVSMDKTSYTPLTFAISYSSCGIAEFEPITAIIFGHFVPSADKLLIQDLCFL